MSERGQKEWISKIQEEAAERGGVPPLGFNIDDPQPGIYDGVSAEVYHSLSLISASGLKVIDAECPAQFRYDLDNPTDSGTIEADIGTAAHLIFLEPEDFTRRVVPLPVDSFQTKAAREARDTARAEGRTPLRWRDYETVLAMRESLIRQVGNLFVGGKAERTYIWRDPRTGVLCKCRPDYTRPELLIDFKTTKSANPRAFRARCFDNSHHIQAWWYLTAHELLTGERASWRWVVQSTKAPYLVTAHKPTPGLLGWAEQQGRAALGIYTKCLRDGSWPGYGDVVWPVELPGWALYQLQERMEAGEFKLDAAPRRQKKPVKPAEVERAIAAYSPLNGGLTS